MITSLQMALGMTVFAAASCLVAAELTSDPAYETAVFLSALLATLNALCALLLSHIGVTRRSMKAFFGAVLGGMFLRMTTTLAGLVVGLKLLLLPALPFAATLLTFTFLFTAAEVAMWSQQNFFPRVELS